MDQLSTITIPVQRATAEALSQAPNLEAAGRLLDRLVRPGVGSDDPLIAFFEKMAAEAQKAGLNDDEIEAELAAHNTERRS